MNRLTTRFATGALTTAMLIVALITVGCSDKVVDPVQLLADAKTARSEGDNRTAIIHLRNLLEDFPDHAEGRYLLGASYSDDNNYPAAERELRRAVELEYEDSAVVPLLAKSLLLTGKYQQTIDELSAYAEMEGTESAESLTLQAFALLGLKRKDEASEMFQQALNVQPEFADALLGQAQMAASDNKLDRASRLIDRTIASEPENIEAWVMKGELARFTGDLEEAIAAYEKALEIRPRDIGARVTLASMHIDAGNLEEARSQLDQMRETEPNSPMVVYIQGLIDFREGNFAAAREAAIQVIEVAPDHMPSVLLAGASDFETGSYDQALPYLERVLRRAPDNLYARRLMVASLGKSGQLHRALAVVEPGLKQYPEDGALIALAGEVYLQMNEFAEAERYFERSAKLAPDSAWAHTQLGTARLGTGQTSYALADLTTASQLDFEQYKADILLVTSNLQQERYDDALKAIRTLEKKQPDNPLTYNLKAAIYTGKEDIPAARKNLKRALELDPTYVPAATNLARLDLKENKPDSARRQMEAILDHDERNVQALLTLAGLGPQLGATTDEQLAWLQRARNASPDLAQPSMMLARHHASTGDMSSALTAAQEAYSISPENIQVLDTLATMQFGAGQRDQALKTYHQLVRLRPESPAALFGLANVQQAVDRHNAATRTLRKALSIDPDFIEAKIALAALEIRAGRFREAMSLARQVQKQAPESPSGFSLQGDVLMAQNKPGLAAKAYESAYDISASGILAMQLHAAYSRAGKQALAEKRLEQWLAQNPKDDRVRHYAAAAALKASDFQRAIGYYESLLEDGPDNVVVLNNLAWAYQQEGQARKALETGERAYNLDPDNAAVADTFGWILVEQDDTTRGLKILQGAVATAPDSPQIRYHLAQAWLKAGDDTNARRELEQLLASDATFPERPEAEKLLAQLRVI